MDFTITEGRQLDRAIVDIEGKLNSINRSIAAMQLRGLSRQLDRILALGWGRRKLLPIRAAKAGAIADVDAEAMTVRAVLSTGTPDRVGDVLWPNGIELANFAKNPICLWQHDPAKPIGRWADDKGRCTVAVEKNRVVGTVHLARSNALAREVYGLVQDGVVNAVSVGFRPLEQPQANEHGGCFFERWELLECSLVSVPCNAEALIER